MTVRSLERLALDGRRVLVRVDYNVPLDGERRITDDARIRASLPTLEKLRSRGCRLTLMSHLGRPKGAPDPQYSLKPVAEHLSNILSVDVPLIEDVGDGGQHGEVQLLENLRFHVGEKKNDRDFAAQLAKYGEAYVNDAFGSAHRAHASIDAVTNFFEEKGAGLLLMKELHYLRGSLESPEKPFVAIMGGSKVSDKIQLIGNLLGKIDALIIGGAMSYTFLKARGVETGKSMIEEDFLESAHKLEADAKEAGVELLLPLDHVSAPRLADDADATITLDASIADDQMGLDIGPETIQAYTAKIAEARTIVWNGPMGVFEMERFSTGTIAVAEAMADSHGLTVIGGGDSAAAARVSGVEKRISHISTGGGASLELLGGKALPGVVALERT